MAEQLVARAREKGIELVDTDGLLMEAEMSDHLGYDKHEPVGRNRGNSRSGVDLRHSPVRRSDLTPCSGRGGDQLAASPVPPAALGQRSDAANHRPKIFRRYRFAPDHKLINLKAANTQLLTCGVADSETTHGHRAYRKCTKGCPRQRSL